MSTKQNKDMIIPVVEEFPNNQNNDDGATSDNTQYKRSNYKKKRKYKRSNYKMKRKYKRSNYKMIDKKMRKKVLLGSYLAICFVAISLCVASFKLPVFRKAVLKGLRMWQWCLLITALLSGPVLSNAIIKFLLLFIERDFSMRENVIYYVVELGKSATVVLWFSMILVAWLWVVEEPSYLGMPQEDIGKIKLKYGTTFHIITVTQVTLILGAFLWLLKDLMMMKAKSAFHIRRFFDRIKKALLHQDIIELLSLGCLASTNQVEQTMLHDINKKKSIPEVGLGREAKRLVDSLSLDVNQENVSCWGMKILIEEIIGSPNLSYYDASESIIGKDISTEGEATQAANTIYNSLAPHAGISHIELSKITSDFLEDKRSDEVMACLREGAHSEHVDIEVFTKWMLKVYRYRKALVRALEANKDLFKAFNRFVDVVLIFLIFALWLIMLRVETRKVIFLIGSAVVGSAFIFGETCKKLLENILFVFIVHPFDIGDCCLIDNTPVIIEEINILTTTVLTFDKEIKHYPNIVLAGQAISNYTRSPDPHMGDFVTLSLPLYTSIDKIKNLKNLMKNYIEDKSQYWSKEHHWVMDLEFLDDKTTIIKMTLRVQHTINYHELIERQIRKSKLVFKLKNALIECGLTPNNKSESDVEVETSIK